MKKLPTFNSENHEFTYFVVMTVKNASAVQAMENRLNVIAEAINELINKDSSINLESFKATLLKELATLLNQKTEFDFSNSLFDLLGTERADLKNSFAFLEVKLQHLTERVSKIESALGHKKIEETEKPNTFDSLD
jgi:hypothetical protein